MSKLNTVLASQQNIQMPSFQNQESDNKSENNELSEFKKEMEFLQKGFLKNLLNFRPVITKDEIHKNALEKIQAEITKDNIYDDMMHESIKFIFN